MQTQPGPVPHFDLDHLMLKVDDLAAALAHAQRDVAKATSPLFWAVYALFGDARALPPAGPWSRWWARRRQSWHRQHCARLEGRLETSPISGPDATIDLIRGCGLTSSRSRISPPPLRRHRRRNRPSRKPVPDRRSSHRMR